MSFFSWLKEMNGGANVFKNKRIGLWWLLILCPFANAIHTCRLVVAVNVCHVSYFINWYAHLFDINMLFGMGNKYKPGKKRHYFTVMITFVSDPFAYGLSSPLHLSLCVRYVLCNIIYVHFVLCAGSCNFFLLHSFTSYFLFESQPSWFVSWSNIFRFFFSSLRVTFFMTNNGMYVCVCLCLCATIVNLRWISFFFLFYAYIFRACLK